MAVEMGDPLGVSHRKKNRYRSLFRSYKKNQTKQNGPNKEEKGKKEEEEKENMEEKKGRRGGAERGE